MILCRTENPDKGGQNIENYEVSFVRDLLHIFFNQPTKCCNYGGAGANSLGYDCVVIPGAAKMTTPYPLIANQAFCGGNGLAYADASAPAGGKTVCCKFFCI